MSKWILMIVFVAVGIADYFLLYQKAKSMNAFVPYNAYIDFFLSTFGPYLLVVGMLSLWLFAKFKRLIFRMSLILVFYVGFYFVFIAMNSNKINGFAP